MSPGSIQYIYSRVSSLEENKLFTWLNKQGVISDEGFVVQFTGRFTAEYREGQRVITVEVEDGFDGGQACITIGPSAFEKWDTNVRLSADERRRILKNFRMACEFQRLKLVVAPL